jgi:hypothetical protein
MRIQDFRTYFKDYWTLILALMILTLGLTYRFHLSLTVGRAGAEPGYDDIVYLLDGKYRLEQLNQDFFGGIYLWISNPPHSPSSSLISLIGQLFSSSNAPAVYLLNAMVITACSYFLIKKIVKDNPLAILFTAVVIISPIGPMIMFNFRPDNLYAIVLTLMIVSAFNKDVDKSIRSVFIYVCFLLLIKPSFILFTVLDSVLLLILLRFVFGKRRINLLYLAKTFVIAFVFVGWYLVNGLNQIINYILSNTTGSTKYFWTEKNYYAALTQNLGNVAGQIGILWSSTLVIIFFLTLIRDRRNLVKLNLLTILLVIGLINLLVSVYSMIGNPFFYLTTLFPFFISMLLSMKQSFPALFLANRSRISLYSVPLFIILGLLPSVEWSASAIRQEGPVGQQLATFIKNNQINTVSFLYAGGLNADTTQWYLGAHAREVQFVSEGLNFVNKAGAISILKKDIVNGELLLTRQENVTGFPSDQLQAFLNKRLSDGLDGSPLRRYTIGRYQLWLKQ